MKYSIDKKAGKPAYLQLYMQLRQDIVDGSLPEGSKLPSKRTLAAELDISVITVEHALALLVDEGYACARPRSGYYAAFGGTVHPQPVPKAAVEDMSASVSAPEDFPFSSLSKLMRRVLSEYGERILIRSPNSGCMELRTAIAEYLARSRGIKVRAEQVVVGSGSEYLYGLVVQLLGRERAYALEKPCYDKIRKVYEANGAVCVGLKMGMDGIASGELSSCHAGVLHVTPYHSFPSGVTATAPKRHEYAAWARAKDAFIVEDDYSSELFISSKQIDTVFSLAPERTIYMNTFTKTLAPSMRTGYMVLPEQLLSEYERKLSFYSCTVPVFDQYVLAEFIRGGDLERYINRRRRKLRQQMQKST